MQMIEQGRQQIAEAQQLYQGLNQLTDVSSIANQLKTDSLRTLGVDVNSLERMARGDFSGGGYGGRPDAIYQDILERLRGVANGGQHAVRSQPARSIAVDKDVAAGLVGRSSEQLVGREGVCTWRARWWSAYA